MKQNYCIVLFHTTYIYTFSHSLISIETIQREFELRDIFSPSSLSSGTFTFKQVILCHQEIPLLFIAPTTINFSFFGLFWVSDKMSHSNLRPEINVIRLLPLRDGKRKKNVCLKTPSYSATLI